MDQAVSTAIVLSPFVVGVVELVKQAGLNSRFAPIVSVLAGIGLAFLLALTDAVGQIDTSNVARTILAGIAAGLIASGVYSGGRALTR